VDLCVFNLCIHILLSYPSPKTTQQINCQLPPVYPLLLDQSTVHDSVEPRWCRGVIWTLSSSSPSIRSHSSRKMRTLHRGVPLRHLWSWLVLASIPPETISNCARESLQEPHSGEKKEGRSAYGLLGSDVRGIGGHGLGGLNLLLDNGRHLPLDQYSTHSIPLKFQSIPWLNYLRIYLFCRASARWCEVEGGRIVSTSTQPVGRSVKYPGGGAPQLIAEGPPLFCAKSDDLLVSKHPLCGWGLWHDLVQ